jgi:hypothetical protein
VIVLVTALLEMGASGIRFLPEGRHGSIGHDR